MANEQIDYSRYQTFWRRFFAIFLDNAVMGIIAAPALYFSLPGIGHSDVIQLLSTACLGILGVLYLVFFVYRFGQTPGKMATGVKILSNDGNPLRIKQAMLREILPIIFIVVDIIFLFLISVGMEFSPKMMEYKQTGMGYVAAIWGLTEIVTMLTNKKRRALHDFIAGTIVIKQLPEEQIRHRKKLLAGLIFLFFLNFVIMIALVLFSFMTSFNHHAKAYEGQVVSEEEYITVSTTDGVRHVTIFELPAGDPKEDEVDVQTMVSETEKVSKDGTKIKVKTSLIRRYKKGQEPKDGIIIDPNTRRVLPPRNPGASNQEQENSELPTFAPISVTDATTQPASFSAPQPGSSQVPTNPYPDNAVVPTIPLTPEIKILQGFFSPHTKDKIIVQGTKKDFFAPVFLIGKDGKLHRLGFSSDKANTGYVGGCGDSEPILDHLNPDGVIFKDWDSDDTVKTTTGLVVTGPGAEKFKWSPFKKLDACPNGKKLAKAPGLKEACYSSSALPGTIMSQVDEGKTREKEIYYTKDSAVTLYDDEIITDNPYDLPEFINDPIAVSQFKDETWLLFGKSESESYGFLLIKIDLKNSQVGESVFISAGGC